MQEAMLLKKLKGLLRACFGEPIGHHFLGWNENNTQLLGVEEIPYPFHLDVNVLGLGSRPKMLYFVKQSFVVNVEGGRLKLDNP